MLAALALAVPAAQAQHFGPATAYPMGKESYPYNMAVGDVNGDGIPDLVATNSISYSAGKLAVLLGKPRGGYGSPTYYSTGPQSFPNGVALGDVTGDGVPDAVVAMSTGAEVFAGVGDGTFQPLVFYSSGLNFRCGSVLLRDLNHDGRLDMVLGTPDYNKAIVFLRQATDFGPPAYYQAANGSGDVSDLALGDMTGDGKDDLVAANFTDNTVTIVPGKGDGSFGDFVLYNAGSVGPMYNEPVSVALADLNQDGRLDVVTANYKTNTIGVLLGQAGGKLREATTYASGGTTAICARLGDFTGDGLLDVAVTNQSGNLGVLPGKNNGTFGPVATFADAYYAQEVVVRDLNGDGRLDVVTADYGPGTLSVLLNTGTYLAANPARSATRLALYPNPAHGPVRLAYELRAATSISAELLDQLGRVVLTLARDQHQSAGPQTLVVPALPAGSYTVRLRHDGVSEFRQLAVE